MDFADRDAADDKSREEHNKLVLENASSVAKKED
jgi:hypothetical protein